MKFAYVLAFVLSVLAVGYTPAAFAGEGPKRCDREMLVTEKGQTMWSFALLNGSRVDLVVAANPNVDPRRLIPGKTRLFIPCPSGTVEDKAVKKHVAHHAPVPATVTFDTALGRGGEPSPVRIESVFDVKLLNENDTSMIPAVSVRPADVRLEREEARSAALSVQNKRNVLGGSSNTRADLGYPKIIFPSQRHCAESRARYKREIGFRYIAQWELDERCRAEIGKVLIMPGRGSEDPPSLAGL